MRILAPIIFFISAISAIPLAQPGVGEVTNVNLLVEKRGSPTLPSLPTGTSDVEKSLESAAKAITSLAKVKLNLDLSTLANFLQQLYDELGLNSDDVIPGLNGLAGRGLETRNGDVEMEVDDSTIALLAQAIVARASEEHVKRASQTTATPAVPTSVAQAAQDLKSEIPQLALKLGSLPIIGELYELISEYIPISVIANVGNKGILPTGLLGSS